MTEQDQVSEVIEQVGGGESEAVAAEDTQAKDNAGAAETTAFDSVWKEIHEETPDGAEEEATEPEVSEETGQQEEVEVPEDVIAYAQKEFGLSREEIVGLKKLGVLEKLFPADEADATGEPADDEGSGEQQAEVSSEWEKLDEDYHEKDLLKWKAQAEQRIAALDKKLKERDEALAKVEQVIRRAEVERAQVWLDSQFGKVDADYQELFSGEAGDKNKAKVVEELQLLATAAQKKGGKIDGEELFRKALIVSFPDQKGKAGKALVRGKLEKSQKMVSPRAVAVGKPAPGSKTPNFDKVWAKVQTG